LIFSPQKAFVPPGLSAKQEYTPRPFTFTRCKKQTPLHLPEAPKQAQSAILTGLRKIFPRLAQHAASLKSIKRFVFIIFTRYSPLDPWML